jgi:hypothetical protein
MLRASILKSRSCFCPDSTHALTRAPKASGATPDTELTPQALAEMSEERFAEILNELQARGELMQLFRALKAHSRDFPANPWDHLQ